MTLLFEHRYLHTAQIVASINPIISNKIRIVKYLQLSYLMMF